MEDSSCLTVVVDARVTSSSTLRVLVKARPDYRSRVKAELDSWEVHSMEEVQLETSPDQPEESDWIA
jgi:hypothetical protein